MKDEVKELSLINPFNSDGSFDIRTLVKESSLTENGKKYFYDPSEKWLVYTDSCYQPSFESWKRQFPFNITRNL